MLREQELIVEMHVEGKSIDHFLSFSLSQSFNAHHYFELRVEHGKLGLPGLVSLEETRDFVGRRLAISFGYSQDSLQNFGGLITQVSLSQSNGYQGAIVISGYSPTILIDRGPDLGSYLGKSLADIAKSATSDAGDGLRLAISPSRTAPLDYLIQYRESDFEFLNRLSASYYEWFFYDGEQLNFGKPGELKEGTLTYGREIKSLDYGIHIAPIKHKRFFYDPKQDEMMDSESSGQAGGHPDLSHAVDRSNEMYSKVFHQPATPRIDSFGDLRDFVNYEEQANVSQLLRVAGESDSPLVGLGAAIQIDTSVRQELAFVTDTLGKFLITKVEHHFDGLGHYTNRFEGVLADSERLPVSRYKTPAPDLQLADVVKNDDPNGQGRIKVKFKWACGNNDETEWLRVLTPDAGSSDKVASNRGLVTIPEVGDQVIVGFEEGNVARPFVLGAVFHGKSGTGGGSGNNVKSLSSKSGHTVELNDAGGITVRDRTQNVMFLDGAGNGSMTTNETINFTCGESSIFMDKAGNVLIKAKEILIQGDNIGVAGTNSVGVGVGPEGGNPTSGIGIESEKLDVGTTTLTMEGSSEVNMGSAKVNIGGGAETNIVSGTVKLN